MKAWTVMACDGEYGTVIWAETRGKARAKGAAELDSEFIEVSVKRSAKFDEYGSFETIPRQMLLDDDWWLPCQDCGAECYNKDYGGPESEAVIIGNKVYCPECAPDYRKEE